MSKGLIDLISILDLEPIEVNMFRGNSPKTSWQRVFGGQGHRTGDGSRHAAPWKAGCRIRCIAISSCRGDPQIPIIYEVERLRDGKSYSTRRG